VYKRYHVTIKFRDKILGGIPVAKELLEPWLRGRGVPEGEVEPLAEKVAEEVGAVEAAEKIEKAWTTFKKDNKGMYIEERQIKGLLREAAFVLRLTAKRGLRDTIAHGVFTEPDKIYLSRDFGEILLVPDGAIETPIHVMTAQGPRSSLKRQDYAEHAEIEFVLKVGGPPRGEQTITEKNLEELWEHAQDIGLGASRSQGYGKFNVEWYEIVEASK